MEGLLLLEPVELIRVQRTGSAAFKCCVAETQGRRPNHEDAHAMFCNGNTGNFWVLDGHRGYNAAHFGASALSQAVGSAVNSHSLPSDEQIQQGFMSVDNQLQGHLAQKGMKKSEGSTVIGALVVKEENAGKYSIKLLNCGDSRGVVVRGPKEDEGSETDVPVKLPQHLERYKDTEAFLAGGASWLPMWPCVVESIDHKPYQSFEKARIEAAGGTVRGGRRARVDGHLSVSRSLGDFDFKDNHERPVEEQKISCMPDIYDLSGVPTGSLLILGCDGLWDIMTSEKAASFVRERLQKDPEVDLGDVAAALVRACLRKLKCRDNVTVLLVELGDGSAWENAQDEMQDFERLQDQKFFDDDIKSQYMDFLKRTGFPSEPRLCPDSDRWLLNGPRRATWPPKKKRENVESRRVTI
jgi:serine/threonine protein phosphatase PrpC